MSDIFNKLIDFRHGSQSEYDDLLNTVGGIKPEDLYYIEHDINLTDQTITLPKLYVGTTVLGDAYLSQFLDKPSKRVTNPIGLIPYGMTLGELLSKSNGSISQVVDLMLFTDRSPSIDECGIIAGFIPMVDIGGQESDWSNTGPISDWINDYARADFEDSKYEVFYDTEGQISTLFTLELDQSKPYEEYGTNAGIYSGRMFVAVPHDSDRNPKDISTIVDKVFMKIYTGSGLRDNFTTYVTNLEFDGVSYPYKIYLFGQTQSAISRLNMEYSIQLD